MPEELKKIHLTTPATDGGINPATITKPNALRDWVGDLPSANPASMAQNVLSSLQLLNRHPAKVAQRPELMRIYLTPFFEIIETARKISCQDRRSQGLSKRNKELLTTATAVCSEMAYGFKHILLNEMQDEIKLPPNECATYIHLAMFSLSISLILDMAAHKPESRTVWREIFQLLIRSQQLGVANVRITDIMPDADNEISILSTFKSIILTSILDTSRLDPKETWGAYDYLSWYAKNAKLTSVEQASDHPGNYLIPRDGVEKPIVYNTKQPPSIPERYMILETHRLNVLISRHLDILSEDKYAPIRGCEKIEADAKRLLLKQMLHIWHTNPKRRHERKDRFDRISCAFGVGQVYHFLKQGTMHQPYADPEAESDKGSQGNAIDPELSGILSIYECRQENISTSGMMILSSDQNIDSLKIGQLIVTESSITENTGRLKVGIVKRIVNRDNSTIEFGVQFLPGILSAATILPEIFGRQHSADLQPSIALELGENQPKALIAPHFIYQANRHYVLDIKGDGTHRVIAGKLLETTNCFDCFEYNILQHG